MRGAGLEWLGRARRVLAQLDSRHLLAAYTTQLALTTVGAYLLALVRVPMTASVAALVLLLAGGAGVALAAVRGDAIFGPRPPAPPSNGARRLLFALGLLGFAAYALLLVPLWHRPELAWDAMTYHVPPLHFWTERGYIHWIGEGEELDPAWRETVDPLFNAYPKGAEVFGLVLAPLTAGHLMNGWNFVLLPLGFLGIYVLGRELSLARGPCFFAASLFGLVPTNVAQSICGYVDTGYAACLIAFLATLFILVRRVLRRAPVTWPLVLTAGGALGLALGIKQPGIVVAVVGGGLFGVAALVAAWRLPRGERQSFARAQLRRLVVLAVCALAVGGYWYVRNWVHLGNPISPFQLKVAGVVVFPGRTVQELLPDEMFMPPVTRPWSYPRRVLYTWYQGGGIEWPPDSVIEHDQAGFPLELDPIYFEDPRWPRSIRHVDARAGGLGGSWGFAALPSTIILAVVLARRGWRRRGEAELADLGAFSAIMIVAAACFVTSPMPWWARYTLWLHGPGLFALAFVLDRATDRARVATRAAVAAFSISLFALCFGEYGYQLKWTGSQPYFVGPPQLHATVDPRAIVRAVTETENRGCGAIFHYLDTQLSRDALCSASVVAVSPLGLAHSATLGQLSQPPGARRVILAPKAIGTNQDAATALFARHFPRYVIWDPSPEGGGPAPILEATATRWVWAYGMQIFEFGHDPISPPPLYPKP